MNSLILRTTTRFLLPLLLLFSVFLLLRGHHEPGGGFSGGLVATSAFALYAIAYGVAPTRRLLRIHPRTLAALGLLLAIASGLFPSIVEKPFLTAWWGDIPLGDSENLHLGSPLFFDAGVYLVVLGAALTMILTLMGEEDAP